MFPVYFRKVFWHSRPVLYWTEVIKFLREISGMSIRVLKCIFKVFWFPGMASGNLTKGRSINYVIQKCSFPTTPSPRCSPRWYGTLFSVTWAVMLSETPLPLWVWRNLWMLPKVFPERSEINKIFHWIFRNFAQEAFWTSNGIFLTWSRRISLCSLKFLQNIVPLEVQRTTNFKNLEKEHVTWYRSSREFWMMFSELTTSSPKS